MEKRATFATKIGVIAATVGSSVGLGNIWRFPYEAGQNGGAAFLLVYLGFVVLLGIPVMLAEFTVGRRSKANVNDAFRVLKPNSNWHLVGLFGILAAVLIMGFYAVIAGWTLEYVFQSVGNTLDKGSPEAMHTAFTSFTSSPIRPLAWTILFLSLNYAIISRGVRGGIEKASNVLMPFLFVVLIIFSIHSLTLDGAKEGLAFLFKPDFSKITSGVVLSAMGQAFFSLSLGMGTLITYASYFGKSTDLPRTSVYVAILDTLVAIIAGVIIFPAVFTYGLSPEQGPELLFVTLPNIFSQMPGGYFWSILFFILIAVAALTSTISLCEVVVAYLHEKIGFTRRRATQILTAICITLSTLCSLSFGLLSDITVFGKNFFDLSDFTASNILLPLGGLLISLFVGWSLDRSAVKEELSNKGTIPMPYFNILIFILKYIAPIGISIIFLSGLGLF